MKKPLLQVEVIRYTQYCLDLRMVQPFDTNLLKGKY